MSQLGTQQPQKYTDGRTKQSFKDETDINKILKKAQKTGTISHLNKYEARYGDFSGFDFFESQLMLSRGREMFDDLPSELRSEFNGSPAQFFDYVNDPENKDRLAELLPDLALPGRQNLPIRPAQADEAAALEAAEKAVEVLEAKKEPETAPEAPEAPSTDTT